MSKNLLSVYKTTSSGTSNGITFTVNSDGSILLNGTSTSTVNIAFAPINAFMLPAGKYKMSNGNPEAKGYMLIGAEQSEWTGQIIGNTLFEKTVYGTVGFCLYQIPKGNTFNNVTIYPSLECVMTTSEMLVEVAKGTQKVFDAGYSQGYESGEYFGHFSGYSEGVNKGIEVGKSQQYDEFWDVFQQNGNRKYYPYAFSFGWNDTNFSPKHPLTNLSQVTYMFFSSEITEVNVDIDIHSIRADAMFSQCKQLQTIKKLIVDEKTVFTSNSFYQCEALENIAIQGVIASDINIQDSPLSKKSIVSIIEALHSKSTANLTLSETAVNNIDWTGTVIDGVTYNTFDEVANTKSDWTIALA